VTGGKVFEQPDKKRELTRQEKQDIEVFGRVTERTHSRMVAELQLHRRERGPWSTRCAARGALQRPDDLAGRGHRPPGGDAHGRHGALLPRQVSALSQETDGRIASRSRSSPASPRPVRCAPATRATAPTRSGSRASACPRLEKAKIPPSLVVAQRRGLARARRSSLGRRGARRSDVYEMLEHGTDFDRIDVF
jgi:hypothetical protein